MLRRSFISSAIAASAITAPALAGSRTLGIRSVSADPYRGPRGRNVVGAVRGVLTFRILTAPGVLSSYKGLESFWSGPSPGDSAYQCPDLIRRYAQKLGFSGYGSTVLFRNLPTLGHGKDCAANFAQKSGGLFGSVQTSGIDLPKIGSVLSVDAWANQPYGHVGIVQRHTFSGNSATVFLFDQNFGAADSAWKSVVFERPAYSSRDPSRVRRWTGKFENTAPSTGRTTRTDVRWTEPTA